MTDTPASRLSWLTAPVAILIGALLIAGAVLYSGTLKTASIGQVPDTQNPPAPTPIKDYASLVTANDPVLGGNDAKVTVVEFSDFQCPYCRQFFIATYARLKKDYIDTGKIRFVFRNFPLSIHASANIAALAGDCANEQGKFWEYHDAIFNEQQKQEPDAATVTKTATFAAAELKKWAQQTGLNASQFNSCLDGAKYQADVDDDLQAGSSSGVSGTPSFFVNGVLLVGAQPFAAFQQAIDAALAK